MIRALARTARAGLAPVEHLFTRLYGTAGNPFHQLGALSYLLFWIVTVTGVYLFIFFDTSLGGAYLSVEYLTTTQWYLGGVMRSLHRYGSDAMAVTVTLHLVREFTLGRYRGGRTFSWVSGVPLLWLLFASAIGGFWLVWDELAQYVAIVTTEWLDWLPNFSEPMAGNFLTNAVLSDRFFSLLVFLHIAIPLFLLVGMFIHIKRLKEARTKPERSLQWLVIGGLVVLSLIKPVVSMGPADLANGLAELRLDWFYLNVYPLIDRWGPGPVWGLLVGFSTLLVLLPWLSPVARASKQVAIVNPPNCNGCSWCYQDCPYEAIQMVPHVDKSGRRMAQVDPDLCTGCGICSGSCPSATPFRHVDELVSGIDLPGFSIDHLKGEVESALDRLQCGAGQGVLVFGCKYANDVTRLDIPGVEGLTLPCIAQLPPSFMDYLARKDCVSGIFITGCSPDDCYARLGSRWVEERMHKERMPYLRPSPTTEKITSWWAGAGERRALREKVAAFASAPPTPGGEGDDRG